jgi:hypothetical protein
MTVRLRAAPGNPRRPLLAQGLTCLDLANLVPFGLGGLAGCGQDFPRLIGGDEHDAVVVACHDVGASDQA